MKKEQLIYMCIFVRVNFTKPYWVFTYLQKTHKKIFHCTKSYWVFLAVNPSNGRYFRVQKTILPLGKGQNYKGGWGAMQGAGLWVRAKSSFILFVVVNPLSLANRVAFLLTAKYSIGF